MKYYFGLQYTRLTRWLKFIGVHPVLALISAIIVFILLSESLFLKTVYAHWIYLFLGTSLIYKLSDKPRNNQLKSIFLSKEYMQMRCIENSIVGTPFLLYLLYRQEYTATLLLFLVIGLLAFIQTNQYWSKTIPTPFKRYPFEFIVGFRKTFWKIGVAYFLVAKALQVDNYNLGLFGMALIFIISMLFYQKPEPMYFVWIHIHRTKAFLKNKFIISMICVSMLSILPIIGMIVGFPSQWMTTLLVYVWGYIMVVSMIVAKYAAYPYEINLPQGIMYVLSLVFPPMLLIVTWIFYSRSKKRLEPILA